MNKSRLGCALASLLLLIAIATTLCSCNKGAVNLDGVELTPIGEGDKTFNFTVTDTDGQTSGLVVSTDEETVGAALLSLDLINGEDGPYGLFVTTALGRTLNFDRDNKYWAFYIDGAYATAGIDKTEIKDGAHYALKAE